jgi:hypothetical protein
LGIGGMPFLLPLLYQVGLGFTPIQSGLLIMPQALAAMSLKLTMPRLLRKIRLPAGADRQHGRNRRDDRCCLATIDHDAGRLIVPVLAFCSAFAIAAIHEHEHARLCGHQRGAGELGEHDREHRPANVLELRGRRRLADDRAVHPASLRARERRK